MNKPRVDQILGEMPQNALDKLVRDVGEQVLNRISMILEYLNGIGQL
jgi:hypothetical protein